VLHFLGEKRHVSRSGWGTLLFYVREGLSCTGSRRVSSKVSSRDQDRLMFGLARPGYFIHKLGYTCETGIYQITILQSMWQRQISIGNHLNMTVFMWSFACPFRASSAPRPEPPSTASARKLDTRRRHTPLSSPIGNLSNDQTNVSEHSITTKGRVSTPASCFAIETTGLRRSALLPLLVVSL